jgi:hypothetical protein
MLLYNNVFGNFRRYPIVYYQINGNDNGATTSTSRNSNMEAELHIRNSLCSSELDKRNTMGWTLLHLAVQDTLDMCKHVVRSGLVTLDAQTLDGGEETALHIAVWNNYENIVQFLLSEGANPDIKSRSGRTALDVARQCGHLQIAKLITTHLSRTRLESPQRKQSTVHFQKMPASPVSTSVLSQMDLQIKMNVTTNKISLSEADVATMLPAALALCETRGKDS